MNYVYTLGQEMIDMPIARYLGTVLLTNFGPKQVCVAGDGRGRNPKFLL